MKSIPQTSKILITTIGLKVFHYVVQFFLIVVNDHMIDSNHGHRETIGPIKIIL